MDDIDGIGNFFDTDVVAPLDVNSVDPRRLVPRYTGQRFRHGHRHGNGFGGPIGIADMVGVIGFVQSNRRSHVVVSDPARVKRFGRDTVSRHRTEVEIAVAQIL